MRFSAQEVPVSMHVTRVAEVAPLPETKWGRAWAAVLRFVRRLDVCWTFFFFIFLFAASAAATAPTSRYVYKVLSGTWDDLHDLRVANVVAVYDRVSERMYRLASTSMSLRSNSAYDMRSDTTLATLCATLTMYDRRKRFLSFSIWSPHLGVTSGCMHGDPGVGSVDTITGYVTEEAGINGTYFVDPTTFLFEHPLRKATDFVISRQSVRERVATLYNSTSLFAMAEKYYVGAVDHIDPKTMWTPDAYQPHLLYFNLPAGLALRGLNINPGPSISAFLRLALNGLTLSKSASFPLEAGERLAVLVKNSLTNKDPLIMSNSWGEHQTIDDVGIFGNLAHADMGYLKCSNVSDPLMRNALRHVNLQALQTDGHKQTSLLIYKGAYATVTAWSYTTPRGLTVPFVYVSPQSTLLPPYLLYNRIGVGVIVAVALLLTALFWSYVHFRFTRPLRQMSELLHRSVVTGQRAMFRQEKHYFFRNKEVEELVVAHNNCMRRLREIDAFVPQPLRVPIVDPLDDQVQPTRSSAFGGSPPDTERSSAPPHRLMSQQSTIVTVSIRPSRDAQNASAIAAKVSELRTQRWSPGQLLDNAVATAASASNMVNCGPFPSPGALEAFATAMNELINTHHGTVLHFCPDRCVVHFGKATRAHQISPAVAAAQVPRGSKAELTPEQSLNTAAMRREAVACVRRDAADAVAFALALQAWMDGCKRKRMPDMRMLLDTSSFVCGLYRNELSGQVMPVALGRDVHREVGHVPERIGVRIAMTEETASLVRARVRGSNTRKVEAGVRQLPVEALRIGRVGLDADVVILYEVLPGAVAGNAPWQLYQRCCFDGFGLMVHGEYGAALGAFKCVADISDLEPGLMPSSLRREAALSDVVGGAVSVQVQRLINECEVRLRAGATEGFRRTRHCPLAIDAVLRGTGYDPLREGALHHPTPPTSRSRSPLPGVRGKAAPQFRTPDFKVERAIVTKIHNGKPQRYVFGGKPEWLEDNQGSFWYVPKSPNHAMWANPWTATFPVLGSAGVLCTVTAMQLCEVLKDVAEAIRDVPDGVIPDAVRRAIPVCTPSPATRAAAARMYIKKQAITHANLLSPVAYSFSIEGYVAILNEFTPGGHLRSICDRYGAVRPLTMTRFTLDILAGLHCLHAMGLAHGALSLENVVVGADGVCRLRHHLLQSRQGQQVVCAPLTCYVSPAMAAGHPPTPQCDIFCFGLLCIEAVARRPCWRWAAVDEEHKEEKAKELREMLQRGGQPFYDAVVHKHIVPAADLVLSPAMRHYMIDSDYTLAEACFSYDPAERPSALQLREASASILARHGFTDEVDDFLKR